MSVKSGSLISLIVFVCFWAFSAKADAPMAFPIVCKPGLTCFVLSYPDMDADPASARDFACGTATKEGDPFLRIGLTDVSGIPINFFVVAADAGRVIDVSQGYADLVASTKSQIKKGTPVCGNGVVIEHAGGIRTGYCHMKRDSITVKKGDPVNKGQVLGFVGQSGVAFWPQLGFSIQNGGFTLDPMTGKSPMEGCGFKPKPMLAVPPGFDDYVPAAIVSMGFALKPQDEMKIAIGGAQHLAQMNPSEESMTFWGLVLGLRAGDRIEVRLRDPRGRAFVYQDIKIEADKDRQLVNINRPRGFAYWREGLYTGEIKVTRTINLKDYAATRQVSLLVKAP